MQACFSCCHQLVIYKSHFEFLNPKGGVSMIKIQEDKNNLKKIIPDFEHYLKDDDLCGLIDELDYIYNAEALSNDGEPTDYAYIIERIRDDLYYDNFEAYD